MTRQEAYERLKHRVEHSPEHFGLLQSRWTLQSLLAECGDWLHARTLPGLWRILRRLRIRFKRARYHVHSPDPDYDRKRQRIQQLRQSVPIASSVRLFYLDEVTYTRQPTLAGDWCAIDAPHTGASQQTHRHYAQPLAELGHAANTEFRVLGALDASSARLHWILRAHIRVPTLRDFFIELVRRHPDHERLYVVIDNWPVHYHPNLLVHLVEQPFAADFLRPPSWPTRPTQPPLAQPLPIVLVPLPTYSPWLNPIEKVWGLSRKHITHLHPYAEEPANLKERLAAYFNAFANGSQELLHSVGLLQG